MADQDQEQPQYPDIEAPVHQPGESSDEPVTRDQQDDSPAAIEADPTVADEVDTATRAAARPWRVAKSLLTLREQVNQKFPGRAKGNDGTIGDARHQTRTSDHNPWVTDGPNGVVTAMDITNDPAHGCDANALAEAIRGSKEARVKYIIWNRRIANSSPIGGSLPWTWRPYHGSNPHDHHVHISVKSDKANYDSTKPWPI